MRLFIAIEFDVLKEYFVSLQEKIKLQECKFTLTKAYHLTLKFLGEVEEAKVEEIKSSLSKVKFEQFKVKLSGIGVFPGENYVRVVWVGVEPSGKVVELQKKIETVLDFPKDNKFHPHISLARVKFVKDKKGFVEGLKKIKVEEREVEVKCFKLLKSTLTPEGPVYDEI